MAGRKKKVSYAVLAMVLALTIFLAACDGGAGQNRTFMSQALTDPQPEVKPMVNSTITWIMPCDNEPRDSAQVEEELAKQLKDRININLKIKWIFWDEYIDKLGIISASGEDYDISWNGDWQSLYQMVAKNAYMDITELLPQYAADYYRQLPDTFWDATKVNGKIICAPNLQKASTKHGLYVRKDINDKYNVTETVKNLDDLEKIFSRIKRDNPKIYCVMKPANLIDYHLIWNDWDYVAGNEIGALDMREVDSTGNIKLFNAYKREEFKETLLRIKRWYDSGFCPPDAPIIEDVDTPARNGQVAFLVTQLGPWPEKDIRGGLMGSPYTVWIPLDIGTGRQVIQTKDVLGSVQCININSKNPEKAVMLLNLINTDKLLYNTICSGIEGKHWILKDGFMEYPQGTTAENSGYYPDCAWAFGNLFNLYPNRDDGADFFDRMKEFEERATPSPAFGFTFDPEPVKPELAQITAITEEYMGALNNGAVNTEKVLAELNDKLDKAGAGKLLAEKQRQLDSWLKTH